MTEGRPERTARFNVRLVVVLVTAGVFFAVFASLGSWQLHRRVWKLALIDRVNARVHAPATPAPGPAMWPTITASGDAYRHVWLTGRFLKNHDTLVQAATILGSGYWLMTPLATPAGYTVLINRGFVPPERTSPAAADPATIVKVEGLLRVTEPGGGFLRANAPASGRWYSRDVAAIARSQGLMNVAPYFVDADANGSSDGPVGGLTVVAFTNNHLVYALTWFTLAAMVAVGAVIMVKDDLRARPSKSPPWRRGQTARATRGREL